MACQCNERRRPLPSQIEQGRNTRPRQWFVVRRNYTRSAFNGYHSMWSEFSDIACRVCGRHWRSKASWVSGLPDCEYWPERVPPKVEPLEVDD